MRDFDFFLLLKSFRTSVILPIFYLLMISCEKQANDVPIEEFKYKDDKKALELIKAGNEFGLDLFRLIAQDDECPENMMMSSVSVAMALGMTYNGSEATTKTAFEQTLRLQGFSREEINNIHKALIGYLLKADPNVVFEIANSIWYRQGFDVLQTFKEINRNYYFAEVSDLDFSSANAVKIINDWIANKTHGKIKNMLDYIPRDAIMYLINALYFNGTWKYEFEQKNSFEDTFYGENNISSNAKYMKNEASYNFFENELVSMVELPYGNGNFVMKILLPKTGKQIAGILEEMTAENLKFWMDGSVMTSNLVVQIPKFKSEYKSLLNDPLKEMGLSEAFNSTADFSGINSNSGIYISRVIHQTFIDVNEKGTEAAAATIVEMIRTSAPEKKYFIANRPFIYAITEKTTGAILFMGKVGKPVYE